MCRMAPQTLALWLLLVGCVLSLGGCQHWSYGLSPGGKRELDSLTDTLNNVSECFSSSQLLTLFLCSFLPIFILMCLS